MAEQSQLTSIITGWQAQRGRHHLPWQQNPTPYKVHVSEIMLQQTQVSTVIPYFERWMTTFPDLSSLAAASEDDVMLLWQGLGYYSRARNLRKAARYLIDECQGEYPDDLTALEQIPGVGRYTAGAIRAFAFDGYGPIVDGNVKRLFTRIFGIYGDPASTQVNKELWRHAEALTPAKSRAFAQGLLDLGATVCSKHNPDCTNCPVETHCFARNNDAIGELPTVKKRRQKPVRNGHFYWHNQQHGILLVKRSSPGIWGGLWCFPEVEAKPANAELIGEFVHEFSHYRLIAQVWKTHQIEEVGPTYSNRRIASVEQLDSIGLPAPVRRFIEDIQSLS